MVMSSGRGNGGGGRKKMEYAFQGFLYQTNNKVY
jgi:hypothetical protein